MIWTELVPMTLHCSKMNSIDPGIVLQEILVHSDKP
jgi:hypothetical protein